MSTLQDEGITPAAASDAPPAPPVSAENAPQLLPATPRAVSVAGPIPNAAPPAGTTLQDEGITPVGEDAQPAFVPPIVQASVLKDGVMNHLKNEDPDQGFDDAVNINMGDLKWPLMAFKGVAPDVAAQVDQLAKSNGLTYGQADSGKEDLGALQQARDIYASLSATDQNGKFIYPNTIKWLQDPVNLAKSKDDVAGLTAVEDAVRAQNQIGESSAMQTARGAASGLEQAAGSVASLPAAATNFIRGVFAPRDRDAVQQGDMSTGFTDQPDFAKRNVTDDPNDQANHPLSDLPDWLSSMFGTTRFISKHATANDGATLQGRSVIGDAQKGDYLGAAQMAAVGIAPVIPVVAASAIDPAFGLGYVGTTSAGSTYQNDIENGKAPDKAAADALFNAEINTIGQGTFGAVGQFERMQQLFATPATRQSATALVGNLIRQTTLSAAQGGLTQGASQVADDAADYATGNKDAFKGEVTKAANAMIIGGLQDGLMAGPAGALEGLHQLSAQSEGASAWAKLTGTVGASKLTQRDPDAMAQFVTDNLTAAGKPTSVGIDADKITTFFQNDNQGFNKFTADMGLKPQEVANAATTGGEISLPIGPYQAKYAGTPLDKAISQDIRFTPGGLSQNEVEAQTAQVQQMQESIKAELAKTAAGQASDLPSHIVTMRDTLMRDKADGGAGYTADQADSQIAVLMAGLNRIAAHGGESVGDVVNRLGLSLKVGDISEVGRSEKPAVPKVAPSVEKVESPGTRVTDANGRRGEIVKEENGGMKVEWADGTTSVHPVDDPSLKRSKSTLATIKNKVVITGLGKKVSVQYHDAEGKTGNTEYGQGTFEENLARARARARDIVEENNLHGHYEPGASGGEELHPAPEKPKAGNLLVRNQEGTEGNANEPEHATGSGDDSPGQSDEEAARSGSPKAAADVLRRAEEASRGPSSGGSGLLSSNKLLAANRARALREFDYKDLADRLGKLQEDDGIPEGTVKIGQGVEHQVFHKDGDTRVTKLTKPNEYGISILGHEAATPRSYLERMAMQNEAFGDDIKWEGVSGDNRTITSQPVYRPAKDAEGKDVPPSPEDIKSRMEGDGFVSTGHGEWYNPKNKIIAGDAFPRNFIKLENGIVHPIDLQLRKANATEQQRYEEKPEVKTLHQDARGAITFQNGKTVIHLLKNADLSTFVHETGHLFLHEMQSLVEQGKGGDQVKADLQTLLDHAGVKPGEKLSVDQEEKIVKSFESYLREGKAPDVGLSGPFNRFRTWLTNIYRSATALGVEPTDEVRQVFDRMLASEDDIAHAQEYYSRKNSVLDLIHATEEDKAAARDKLVKVQQSEYEKQARAYMKSYLQAVGGMSAIRESAKAAVENHPVYKALETAKDGEIDEADLRQAIGSKGLKEFTEKFPNLVKENGEHSLASLAAKHGFQSPETLADNLQSAVPKSEAIKNYTTRLVQEKDQQIRDEIIKRGASPADHVMHSEGSLAYLIAETNLMAKQANGKAPKLIAATYREAARQAIADMKVSKAVRFSDFAKTEARLGKDVLRLAKAGKWDEALEARKKQMAQHAMVQAAIEAKDERTEIVRRFAPTKLESKIKNVDNAYVDPVRQILSTYGLSDIPPKAPYDLAQLADVDRVLFSQLPTWLIQGKFAGRTNDLTMDQLRSVNDAARSVLAFGNGQRKSDLAMEQKTIGEIVEKSVSEINALPDKDVRQLNGSMVGNRITKGLQALDWTKSHLTKAQFLFKRLDNFSNERNGTIGILEKMFHGMREGENNQSEAQRAVYDQAKPHLAVLRDAAARLRKENGDYFAVPGVEKPEVYQTKGRKNWSPEELIAYMMNTGAEGNISALKNSFGHDTAEFDKVAQQFSAKELEAMEGVRDSISTLFDGLNETNFKIYNRHVEKVDAVPQDFTDKDGVPVHMKGGYWPLMFDYEMNRLQGKYSDEDVLKGQISGFMRSAKPEDGMTKSRVVGHALAPRLDMGVFGDHVDDTTRFIHMAPIVRDLDRVMQSGEWRDAVVKKIGPDEYKQVREWLADQANPGRKQTTDYNRGWDKIANYAQETATASALGFNFVAGLKWRTSALNSAIALGGWRHIINGYAALGTRGLLTSTLGLSNSKTWHMMEEKSMLLKAREEKGIRDIRQDVEKLKWNQSEFKIPGTNKTFTTADLKNAMYAWAKMNDRAIVAPVWMGGYLKYKNEMGDASMSEEEREKEAIHYADSIISSSQPSSLNVDMNSAQRNQGAILKLFTMFMSYPYTIANRFMYQAQALKAGAITKTEYTNHVLQEVILEPLARVGISAAFLATVPSAATIALAPMNNLIGGIPGLSQLANLVESGFDASELSPAFDVLRKARNVYHDVITDKDITQLAWDVARLTTYLTKAPPVLNIVKTLLDFGAEAEGTKNTYK
jgi:hypothetical protein